MPRRRKILSIPLKLLVIVALIGSFFKLQHYPGATKFLTIGLLGVLILYPIRFAWKRPKRLKDWVKLIYISEWVLSGYLKLIHYYEIPYSGILGSIAFLSWIVLEAIDYFYYQYWEYPKPKALWVLITGIILLHAGLFMKLQHYSGTLYVLTLGCLLTIGWLGKELPMLLKAKIMALSGAKQNQSS